MRLPDRQAERQWRVRDGAERVRCSDGELLSQRTMPCSGRRGSSSPRSRCQPGATASVSVVPLGSTVMAGTALANGWSGTSTLPSTGDWSATVTVTSGSETCVVPPTQLSVVCLAGFELDATTGQCFCPSGTSNINGACEAAQSVCDAASASFSLDRQLQQLGSTGQLVSSLTLPAGATASVSAVPTESTVTAGTALANGWSGTSTLPSTGEWSVSVTVTSGSETCTLPSTQLSVACVTGLRARQCDKGLQMPAWNN